jgi:hypothetical protein
MSAEHHPSCTPNDRDLVWHCNQCGLNESAADIEEQLAAEREKTLRWCKYWEEVAKAHDCENLTDAFVQLTKLREQLAAERAKPKTTEYAQGWDDHVLAARSQR